MVIADGNPLLRREEVIDAKVVLGEIVGRRDLEDVSGGVQAVATAKVIGQGGEGEVLGDRPGRVESESIGVAAEESYGLQVARGGGRSQRVSQRVDGADGGACIRVLSAREIAEKTLPRRVRVDRASSGGVLADARGLE